MTPKHILKGFSLPKKDFEPFKATELLCKARTLKAPTALLRTVVTKWKTPKNHFSAAFLKGKMDFGNFDVNWKKRPKINFLAFLQLFRREKMDFGNFDENWKKRSKIFFWPFCSFSEGKKWTLEILMKIEKIAQKSFF